MRAWRLVSAGDRAGGTVAATQSDIAEPELAGDSVLVRVSACVIGAPERQLEDTWTPGAAAVGTVERAGSEAEHLLGARVILGPEQACGECDICRRAEPVLCPNGEVLGRTTHGALAELVRVRARWLCALLDDLDSPALATPAAALLGREAAWAYTMFARAGVAPGEPVFVVGRAIERDVVARFVIEIAIAKGTRPMVLHEPGRTEFADWLDSVGALSVPVASSDDARAAAERVARAAGHGQRPWFVFETSAHPDGRARALSLCVPGSRQAWLSARALGDRRAPQLLALDAIADMDATLVGVTGAHPDLLPELAALVVRGELDIEGAARVTTLAELAGATGIADGSAAGGARATVVTLPAA